MDLKTLKSIPVGTHLHPRFPEQDISQNLSLITLDELFAFVQASPHAAAKRVEFNIETKTVPGRRDLGPDAETFARLVVECVRKYNFESRVIVQSFDVATLYAVRAIAPKIRLSFLNADSRPDYAVLLHGMDIEILSPHHQWITKEDVAALHRDGRQVIPWTANNPDEWDALLALGVDGIITDDPEALIQYLVVSGRRRPAATHNVK